MASELYSPKVETKKKSKERTTPKLGSPTGSFSNKEDEISKNEYQISKRKSGDDRESQSTSKPKSPDSSESFLNPNLSYIYLREGYFRDSGTSSICSEESSTIKTGRILSQKYESKKRKERTAPEIIQSEEIRSIIKPNSFRSQQSSKKKQKSCDSLQCPSENILLRNAHEILNFNVRVREGMGNRRFRSKLERIELSDLSVQREINAMKSTETTLEEEMKVYEASEKDMFGSTESAIIESAQSLEPQSCNLEPQSFNLEPQSFNLEPQSFNLEPQSFNLEPQSIETEAKRSNMSVTKNDEKQPDQNLLSKMYIFGKDVLFSYFFQKEENGSKNSKSKKKDVEEVKPTEEQILEIKETEKEDLANKQFIQEFFFYLIFLIFFTTIALSMVSSNMYYLSEMTASLFFDTPFVPLTNKSENGTNTTLFFNEEDTHSKVSDKTLRHSLTIEDFWEFAETTMIRMFHWNFLNPQIDPSTHTKADDRKMMYENQLLGVPRMRQVRVRNDSCEIHPDVKRFFKTCYYYYSVFSEETRPIKEGMESNITATAWVYKEAKYLNSSYYWGEISIYGGGGYYLDLALTEEDTKKMVQELKKNIWVARATRAIFIDFNLYNANVNLFCLCKIVLEFPPVGGMIPRADFHALKLIRYMNIFDFFILGCEITFVLLVIYYTILIIKKIMKHKILFFFFFWNYVDLLLLFLSYTYVLLGILSFLYVRDLIEEISQSYYQYVDTTFVKDLQITYNNVIAVLLFICWVKIFKYFNFNIKMVEFKRTLSKSIRDILGFFPLFLIMFTAFALLAYLLFGNQVKDYDTVGASFLALLQTFLGEFEYKQIQESNRILGPIFYVAFIFFIFFVLLNMFIAIINDAYYVVKSEVISNVPKTGEYFKRGFLNFLGFCCCGLDKKLQKKSVLRRNITYEKIRLALKNAGFDDVEIRIFFSKYNINVNNILDEKTQRKLIEDLELRRVDFVENEEQFQISTLKKRIDKLNERIEEIAGSLQPIIDKVDVLLNRL